MQARCCWGVFHTSGCGHRNRHSLGVRALWFASADFRASVRRKPIVISVVLQALWALRRAALKSKFLAVVGAIAIAASFAGFNVLVVLLGTGILAAATRFAADRLKSRSAPGALFGIAPFGLLPLFLFFLKVGALLFGSGYMLLAFLSRGPGWALRMADGKPSPQCHSRGPGYSRTCVHHGNFHWLCAWGHPRGSRRHSGDISALVLLRGIDRATAAASPSVRDSGGIPRWGQRGRACPDDICNLATKPLGNAGYSNDSDHDRECRPAFHAAVKRGLAHHRRSGSGLDSETDYLLAVRRDGRNR